MFHPKSLPGQTINSGSFYLTTVISHVGPAQIVGEQDEYIGRLGASDIRREDEKEENSEDGQAGATKNSWHRNLSESAHRAPRVMGTGEFRWVAVLATRMQEKMRARMLEA
jgi:hypothetical protein